MSEQANIEGPSPGAVQQAEKPAAKSFGITDNAVRQLRKLMEDRGTPTAGLRIAVKGGGCSGLSYTIDWADAPREKDRVFERDQDLTARARLGDCAQPCGRGRHQLTIVRPMLPSHRTQACAQPRAGAIPSARVMLRP